MESMNFSYPKANKPVTSRAHVGVVASGDLEVLIEPAQTSGASVSITTSVHGFQDTWKVVMDRFFNRFDKAVEITINDAGATPGSVMLRLQQAAEVLAQ